eukprot:CAMPEP_0202865590 /NCGR_PEP_ID=MMETSP1391-20130828/6244_1 /ASSEMBLY_ACC=CAM_ASM_000867 /TAXON_ID=1034604 /ORGANISM="Chlamydomonas leiostraca, Strain SAG 11-49" /LENGTH=268 /DNA_ID=CAMNT_0049545449 /DNA_START=108 /DNA_END=911 /DNA_ORIENTATION=+
MLSVNGAGPGYAAVWTRLAPALSQLRLFHMNAYQPPPAQGLSASHLGWHIPEPEAVPEARRTFPSSVWSHITGLLHHHGGWGAPRPHAVDIGCGGGAGCVGLARTGARVTGIDDDVSMLAHASEVCEAEGAPALLLNPRAAAAQIAAHSADLVLVSAPHDSVLRRRLLLAHQLLARNGHAVLVWNDRDLSHPLVAGLEGLLEAASAAHLASQQDARYASAYMVMPTCADLAAAGEERACVQPNRPQAPTEPECSSGVGGAGVSGRGGE